jgi:translin
MRKHFDAQEKLRERVLQDSRRVVRLAARTIAAMHRGEQIKASKMLKQTRLEIRKLEKTIKPELHLRESGTVLAAYQEYCEAAALHSLISKGKLPEPERLGVPYKPYLAAMSNVAGELRRCVLDSIRADDLAAAERALNSMEEIFELLMSFDYPDAVLPGMKRRQDSVRHTLERTRGDFTIALRQQRLEKSLERAKYK